jgi:hypothetical protein
MEKQTQAKTDPAKSVLEISIKGKIDLNQKRA